MANPIQFYLTTSDKLTNIEIKKGNLIFCRDIRTIYLDDDTRTAYQQIIELPTDAARAALAYPINTFYFVDETCVLWKYGNGEWHQLTTSANDQIVFARREDFPAVGNTAVLYVDGTNMYRYLNGQYLLMSGTFDWGTFG